MTSPESWSFDALASRANELAQAAAERDPRKSPWGIFGYSDAPGGIGGGCGFIQWFSTKEDLLTYVTDYSAASYQGFDSEAEWQALSSKLRATVGLLNHDAASFLEELNAVLKGAVQFEWLGTFDELCSSKHAFCKGVREWYREQSDDSLSVDDASSPIESREVESFVEEIRLYGI